MLLKRVFLLIVLFSLFLYSACQRAQTKTEVPADAKRYELTGKIISVDKKAGKATVQHEEIKGYMAAMEMKFSFRQDWVVRELEPGDQINAQLIVESDSTYYLDEVGIMKAPRDENGNIVQPISSGSEKIGAAVPDFKLVNQDNKKISFKDFSGKTLVATFIYTRCPLPDQCPLMSINLSDLEKQIRADASLRDNTKLLSITFDPANDTPEALRKYGAAYFGKDTKPSFDIWQLATGDESEIKAVADFFGMQMTPDGSQIIHNLRTIIITPDGKIAKIYAGNEWRPADVLRDLQAVSKT